MKESREFPGFSNFMASEKPKILEPARDAGLLATATNWLNLHDLRSNLSTPDGIITVVLLTNFDNVGSKRL